MFIFSPLAPEGGLLVDRLTSGYCYKFLISFFKVPFGDLGAVYSFQKTTKMQVHDRPAFIAEHTLSHVVYILHRYI